MGRKTHEKAQHEVDLLVPIDSQFADTLIEESSKDDCFAKEWSPSVSACSQCADNMICSILVKRQQVTKIKEVQGNQWFLDEANFDKLNQDKLADTIKTSGTYQISDIEIAVAKLAKCDDKETVRLWVQGFMNRFSLKATETGVK